MIITTKYGMMLMVAAALFLTMAVQGQKKQKSKKASEVDTLSLVRQFVTISNVYQQLPLYLEMELRNSTNFITGEADTATVQAVFHIQHGNCYVRFGEAEQLVNDSMALIISDKLQRMVLYSDAQPAVQRMQAIIKMLKSDSSMQNMAQRFIAGQADRSEGLSSITLTARELLHGTGLPTETIELQFSPATREPVKVITTKRTLVALSEDDFKVLESRSDMAGKLLKPGANRYFLVKEQLGAFIYKTIKHEKDMRVPFTISDRLMKTETGEYVPVKRYESYALTYN